MFYDEKFDIIVVGLGTAGAESLITAAERGLNVLGIERLGAMGGTGTLGGISHYYYGSPGGGFEKLDEMADELRDKICAGCTAARTDVRAYIFEREALQNGAQLRYNSVVTDVYKDNGRICGIEYLHGGRLITAESKVIIDATGEAEVCRMAGCRLQGGRESDGQMQTYANVAMVKSGRNVYGINRDAGYIRQNECASLSRQIIASSALSVKTVEDLRERVKFIANTALIGCREGQRIVGEANITFSDCCGGSEPEKPVFYAFSNLDSHSKDTAFEDTPLKDWYIAAGLWGVSVRTAIPMGALIPKDTDGILAAGRCISATHEAAACVRMMRDVKKCGEAAAVMACMAVEADCGVRDIAYDALARELKKSGCLKKSTAALASRDADAECYREFEWLDSYDDIVKGLASDAPGVAIWSVKLGGMRKGLLDCLKSENELLRRNSAIALGLTGERAALPELRRMAEERDLFIPKSSVKFTYARGVSAVYLLGRMRDTEAVELLLDIVRGEGGFDEEQFQPDELHPSADDMRFMFIQNAVASLAEIADFCPEKAEYIYNEIKSKLLSEGFDIKIGLKGNSLIKFSMSDILKRRLENKCKEDI